MVGLLADSMQDRGGRSLDSVRGFFAQFNDPFGIHRHAPRELSKRIRIDPIRPVVASDVDGERAIQPLIHVGGHDIIKGRQTDAA